MYTILDKSVVVRYTQYTFGVVTTAVYEFSFM